MIKSVVALYSNKMFHVSGAKIIRDSESGQNAKTEAKLPYRNEKHPICYQVLSNNFLFLCLQEFLLQAAHARGGVVATCPG